MDTFTTRSARPAGGHRHHQGFCTVCGTVWPCWRGLAEDAGAVVTRRPAAPLLASVSGPAW